MELSPSLRVLVPDPYVYRTRLKRRLAGLLDWLGDLWLAPRPQAIEWKKIRRVAVLRLDHLGDLLNAFPAILALKKALPHAEIDLYVGPWGRELSSLVKGLGKVIVVEASWFGRPKRLSWPWKAIWNLGSQLREGDYDLAVDLRGELRHMLALWISATPLRLGHTLTAGRFLLTHAFAPDISLHESQRNSELFARAGLRLKPEALKLAASKPLLKLPRRFVAIQAACGTPAKRWRPERWAQVIDRLKLPAVLLGSRAERDEMRAIAALCKKKKPLIAAGELDLAGLCGLLSKASLVLSVDSGPAHLAAAMGRPVLSLYSATNRVSQWGVLGKRTRYIQKSVPCGPCELTVCPYGNECMARIEVDEVLQQIKALLR